MREQIKKSKALKYILIGVGVIAFGSSCYFLWWNGFHTGCRESADASIRYLKENYPDAYNLVVSQWPQSN